MSVRVRFQVKLIASLDDDEKKVHFERLDDTLTSVIRTFDVEESGQLVLSASEADYAIPMGKVNQGALLYIESDKELGLEINGDTTAHKIVPTSGSNARLLWEGEFTQAPLLTNNTAEEAQVSFIIAGSKA